MWLAQGKEPGQRAHLGPGGRRGGELGNSSPTRGPTLHLPLVRAQFRIGLGSQIGLGWRTQSPKEGWMWK